MRRREFQVPEEVWATSPEFEQAFLRQYEAEVMEALEITVLARWGIGNPYDDDAAAPDAEPERNTRS